MPFKSTAQKKYLWANRPDIAERWTAETGGRVATDPPKDKTMKKSGLTALYGRSDDDGDEAPVQAPKKPGVKKIPAFGVKGPKGAAGSLGRRARLALSQARMSRSKD